MRRFQPANARYFAEKSPFASLGGAIVSMHYIGMAAMRSAAMHYYKLGLVVLSVVVAVTFSSGAAWLAFRFGRSHQGFTWIKVTAASLMGVGIASMHYTAMAAAYFMPGHAPLMRHTVEVSTLGAFGIGTTTLLLLGTTLVTMSFDRRLANERLLQHLYGDLQEREAKIRRLVDANIIGIFTGNLDKIVEANEAFLHMLGYSRDDLVSGRLRWMDLTPTEWRHRLERAVAEMKTTGTAQPYEKEYFRKDGSRVPVLIGVATFDETGNQGVAFVLDLTERKRAEEEIRALSERLFTAQEEERTRIARQLHDDLNQEIAAVVLSLSRIRPALKEREPQAGGQLEKAVQRLVCLSSSVRDLSHQLHPAILEHSDLATALAASSAEFSSVSGVTVSFATSGSFADVPQGVALCIYRVTQEALQNVAKHAAAREASVHLDRTGDGLRLTVSDRGVGFHPVHARASVGLGLVSMREHVRLVRGVLGVESQPNRGTTLTVEIPLTDTAQRAVSTFGGLRI